MIQIEQKQRRLGELKSDRESWVPHWKELVTFFQPRRSRWLEDSVTSRGNKMNQKLIDPSPRFAVRTAGAGIHAGSTNPAVPWFKITTDDNELNEYPGVANWFYTVEQLMRAVFDRSNLYSVLPSLYCDGITFGTAPMLVMENARKVIHCVPNPIGSYYLATNYEGDIDTKYCEYKMTTAQMMQEFGDKNATRTKELAKQGKNEYHDVLHIIEPNEGREYGNYSAQHMPFRSCYIELANEKTVLRESGFEDNPLACLRWETTEITDSYGSSPGMDALGAAKAMQLQQKRKAQAIDKHVDPPMVGDPMLQQQRSSLLPGDVTYAGFTPTGSAPKFQPAYIIKPELQGLMLDIEDVRAMVDKAMYVDLFLAITRADPRNASVPEIAARKEEQILGLGPMLQNHRKGLIQPVFDRTFYIMMRQGRLPPPPPELEGMELKVEMIGTLAQALKAIQGTTIERFGNYVAMMAKVQADSGEAPTALDKMDVDQSIDEYALAIGVPPTTVRGDDAVAELRAQRQAAQEQAAQLEQAAAMKDATQAAKNLSETDVGGQSALEAMAQ